MNTKPEYIKEIMESYEHKARIAMTNYQDSGRPGYYRSYEKNTKMAEICQTALNSENIRLEGYEKRIRNISAYKEKLEKRDYSFEEIENIFSHIMQMLGQGMNYYITKYCEKCGEEHLFCQNKKNRIFYCTNCKSQLPENNIRKTKEK